MKCQSLQQTSALLRTTLKRLKDQDLDFLKNQAVNENYSFRIWHKALRIFLGLQKLDISEHMYEKTVISETYQQAPTTKYLSLG